MINIVEGTPDWMVLSKGTHADFLNWEGVNYVHEHAWVLNPDDASVYCEQCGASPALKRMDTILVKSGPKIGTSEEKP